MSSEKKKVLATEASWRDQLIEGGVHRVDSIAKDNEEIEKHAIGCPGTLLRCEAIYYDARGRAEVIRGRLTPVRRVERKRR